MLRYLPTLLVAMLAALAAPAQSTPAHATSQTGSGAPGATSPAATAAQAAEAGAARNSSSYGSAGAARTPRQGRTGASGRQGGSPGGTSAPSGASGQSPAAGNAVGITGVPRYRAGFRGPRGTQAPVANAAITVTGENDGSSNNRAQSLPGMPVLHNAFGIAPGTPMLVRLQQPVDSGHAKNGDLVRGVLASAAGSAPAGAQVQLTVVAVAAAGQMASNGELSLQVVSVNGERVLSEVITAEGKEGEKILADDAPGRGTEAAFTPEQPLSLKAG